MEAVLPEIKKTLNEGSMSMYLDGVEDDDKDFDTLYAELMNTINGRTIDFVKADGEGITLDTVVDNKNLRIDVIYPNGKADTNIGEVDLEDTLADEDDLYTLIDVVNDYSDEPFDEEQLIGESLDIEDEDEDMPKTVVFFSPTYGEITAVRCFNPDANTMDSYWECSNEDGEYLCEFYTDAYDEETLSDKFEEEMDMHTDDLWDNRHNFDDKDEFDLEEDEDEFEDYEF
jgi:hypothetical protein